jgi:polyisoprenoid-binding protein YceI
MTARWLVIFAGFAALVAAAQPVRAQDVLFDKSEIRFVAKQLGVNVEGRFRKWKANVLFLPKDLAKSKAEFDIDLGSIDLASEDSEREVRDRVWFDTAKFPVAHFVSTSIREQGGDKYDVTGQLTLKGIKREMVVPVAVRKDATGNSVAEGTFNLKRLDYNIGEGLWADTDMVKNEVIVRVRIVLPPLR